MVLRLPDSWSNCNLEVLVFEERGKPEYPGKNLSEQRREPTTNSTQIWPRRQDLNPDHTDGRRVLSPLRHPCSSLWKCVEIALENWYEDIGALRVKTIRIVQGNNLRFYVFLPNRCMVPGVIFLPILGETGYRLRVPLRNTSSGQFSHCALPWCNRRSILTSESYKYNDSITFLPVFEVRAIFMPKIDPSTVFSTFDWDQLAKIRQQHSW